MEWHVKRDDQKETEQRERYTKEEARKDAPDSPPRGLETNAPSYTDDTGSTSLGVDEPIADD